MLGVRPMLATTFAANALSVSVPLADPEPGTAFTFRRYTGSTCPAQHRLLPGATPAASRPLGQDLTPGQSGRGARAVGGEGVAARRGDGGQRGGAEQ